MILGFYFMSGGEIAQLAQTIKVVAGYPGKLGFGPTKPDGAARKLMDVSRLNNLGWEYNTSLEQGLKLT